jgi:hypothetical protein
VLVLLVAVVLRVGRDVGDDVALARFGWFGLAALVLAFVGVVLGWRLLQHRRTRRAGGEELTPTGIRTLLADSALGGPAFPEDGTLFGASVFALCQRSMVLELRSAYDIFGSNGEVMARVRQVGQSRAKILGRLVTSFDQFFTHHFDVVDAEDRMLLRLSRPRKIFLTKVHVFDGWDRFLGTIQQENVFGRIRFRLVDPAGMVVGRLHADKLQAWDFQVLDPWGRPVATIVKAWEGWARTVLTRADRYAVRIHVPVEGPLRPLTLAAALAIDLGLKQDTRGLG